MKLGLSVFSAALLASSLYAVTPGGIQKKYVGLLVSDYRGKERELMLDVKGAGKIVSATLLDHERNNEPCEVKFEKGKLILKKELPGSAAFLVTFAID